MQEVSILLTDERCVINDRVYEGLPILIDQEGNIYEEQTDYIRYLAVDCGRSMNTVLQTSKALKVHLELMHAQGSTWKDTDHHVLLNWRNWYVGNANEQKSKRAINGKLSVIYKFLIWAQRNNLCHDVVGPFSVQDRKIYPLPVNLKTVSRDGISLKIDYPLLYKTIRDSDSRNASPDDVNRLFIELNKEKDPRDAVRNILIANWAEGPGCRVSEVLAITVDQLPTLEIAREAASNGELMDILLTKTKGGKRRRILVKPRLVIDTWGYINDIRDEIVKKKDTQDTAEIFISHRSGKPLKANTISKKFSQVQKKLGIKKASIHRLRSIAITNHVRNLFEIAKANGQLNPSVDGILLKAQEFAGHNCAASTLGYIRLEQSRNLNFENKEDELRRNREEFARDEELGMARGLGGKPGLLN